MIFYHIPMDYNTEHNWLAMFGPCRSYTRQTTNQLSHRNHPPNDTAISLEKEATYTQSQPDLQSKNTRFKPCSGKLLFCNFPHTP